MSAFIFTKMHSFCLSFWIQHIFIAALCFHTSPKTSMPSSTGAKTIESDLKTWMKVSKGEPAKGSSQLPAAHSPSHNYSHSLFCGCSMQVSEGCKLSPSSTLLKCKVCWGVSAAGLEIQTRQPPIPRNLHYISILRYLRYLRYLN